MGTRVKKTAPRKPGKVTENDRTALKKALFLESYETAYGNVTLSCKLADISRETYYRWTRTDPEFLDKLSAIRPKEKLCDLAENGLVTKLVDKDITAIIFTLKTLGKDRGYVERTEIGGGGAPLGIRVVTPDADIARDIEGL